MAWNWPDDSAEESQDHARPPKGDERRGPGRTRGDPSPGRRRTDYDPRTTISKKLLVATVFVINALYLAGEAVVFGHSVCP